MKKRPFLKWPGGKYRVLDKILNVMPSSDRLIEPFLGSGAVFLNTDYKRYLLAEINPDLIDLYKTVRAEGTSFFQYAKSFIVPKNNNAKKYYQFRDLFNRSDDIRLKSALFIYLNRYGYNGLCRYNQSGEFNVPFGNRDKHYFPLKELEHFQRHSKNARFVCQDFRKTMQMAKSGDIVYCDPPYVGLSATSNFSTYSGNSFKESDQHDLVEMAELLREKEITVIISNHDTPFTRKLYRKAKIYSFEVARTISRHGAGRKPVKELLALYHPD